MSPKEAVKMCACGTFGGYFVGEYTGWQGQSVWHGLLNPTVAEVVDLVVAVSGAILMFRAIWWLFHTVVAIGRSNQGSTRA
jgi:hypothetical protein